MSPIRKLFAIVYINAILRSASCLPAACLTAVLLPQASPAATATWTGSASSDWTNGSNWSSGTVATGGDTAVFGATVATPANQPSNALSVGSSASPLFGLVFQNTGAYNVSLSGGNIFLGSGGLTSTRSTAGTVTLSNNIRATTDQVWNIGTGALVTMNRALYNSGAVGNSNNFEKTGAGTLVLVATNGDIGGTGKTFKITQGVVSIAGNGALGSTNSTLTLNGGTLQTTATFTQDRLVTMSADSTINVAASTVLTNSRAISGAGGITKTGTGTLRLEVANSYTGTTTLSEGILSVAGINRLGNATNGFVFSGGTLLVTASTMTNLGTLAVTFTTGANVGFDISAAGNNFQLTNNLNHGNGGLTFSATGGGTNRQMTLLGSNSAFTGTITVNSGKLNLGGDTGGGSNSVSASNALVINDGMVSLGQVFTNVNATIGALSGGTNAILNTLNGTGAGVRRLVVDQAINTTFAGRLQEDATNSRFLGLTKTGTGTLTLSGVNTYSGTTILSGGALRLSSTAAAGTGTLTQADATSTLEINVTGTITNNMSLYNVAFLQGANLSGALTLNNTVFDVTNNVTATNSGTLSGSGGVDKIGAGTLVLSGANIYEGGTTISNGAVSVSSDGNLGLLPVAPEAGNVTLNGGKLLATSGFTLGANRGISVGASGGTVEVAASQNLGYGGIVSGLGALTKAGAGTFTLSGSSSFSGATTVSGGVLELANSSGSALGSVASVSVATNATLLISQGGQVNDGASISLSGGTIRTATGVSEAFGDLTVTGSGFLDFGTTSYANANTITFGTYTPSALLTIDNFNFGSTLVFKGSNLSGSINNTSLFTFTNGGIASSSWDSGSNTFTITAIPEPSAAVAMLGLLMFCLWPVCSPLFRSRSQKGNSL